MTSTGSNVTYDEQPVRRLAQAHRRVKTNIRKLPAQRAYCAETASAAEADALRRTNVKQ